MRRARRKRLDHDKLELKTQQIAAYIYETKVINPVVIKESSSNPTRYKHAGVFLNIYQMTVTKSLETYTSMSQPQHSSKVPSTDSKQHTDNKDTQWLVSSKNMVQALS